MPLDWMSTDQYLLQGMSLPPDQESVWPPVQSCAEMTEIQQTIRLYSAHD